MKDPVAVVNVAVHNESVRRRLYTRSRLAALAQRIFAGEGIRGAVEVSVLFCDDERMRELNNQYRRVDAPTDVLSFEQEKIAANAASVLGDVVISLETVERHCGGDRAAMRSEVDLLFCHGLLHLLGYDHGNASERQQMQAKQATYLQVDGAAAWAFGPRTADGSRAQFTGGG